MRRLAARSISAAVLALCAWPGLAPAAPKPAADTIYLHGRVITVDPAQPTARAIAVRGDKIIAVGDDRRVPRLRRPGTRVVDLGGKVVVPGFVDGHSHIADMVATWRLADLSPPPVGSTESIAALQRAMRDYIAANPAPAGQMVFGLGYDDSVLAERRHPSLAELDVTAVAKAPFARPQEGGA